MKTLKFRSFLIPKILSGEKNSTWRLFDDKNLLKGDEIQLVEWGTDRVFGVAGVINVTEKPLGKINASDMKGHEGFASKKKMYEAYKRYYQKDVGPDTLVKIVKFELKK